MKKTIFALMAIAGFCNNSNAQGFTSPALQWNIPAVLDDNEYRLASSFHTVIDMNGDGLPDLIDSENQATNGDLDVFFNGQQKYWKVYLSTGVGFSPTSIQWNLPAVLDTDEYSVSAVFHQVIDMNGDRLPDLVDTENHATNGDLDVFFNGQQKYWKVYLNNGAGFNATAIQWNIPAVLDDDEYRLADAFHTVIDMNGDGKPDLIDSENQATNGELDVFFNGQQKYWKVYLNTGTGFSPTAVQWNIPAVLDNDEYRVSYTLHTVIDMDGDGKPDLVDTENEATNNNPDVFYNGQQKYWKFYKNNGAGFNTTATQWNIPAVLDNDEYMIASNLHTVIDMDGDGKPDLIDSENEATNNNPDVFYNGQQKYWKVYKNNGNGFNLSPLQWNIPAVLDSDEYMVSYTLHTVIDMNGDLKPDLVDTENEATNNNPDVFFNGQQKYWKVYLNGSNLATDAFNIANAVSIYPNPFNGKFELAINDAGADFTIEIYNTNGQLVLQRDAAALQTIDLSEQATGLYLVKIANGQTSITKKIVKQ